MMMLLPVQMCSWSALGHSHRDGYAVLLEALLLGALNPKSRGPGLKLGWPFSRPAHNSLALEPR